MIDPTGSLSCTLPVPAQSPLERITTSLRQYVCFHTLCKWNHAMHTFWYIFVHATFCIWLIVFMAGQYSIISIYCSFFFFSAVKELGLCSAWKYYLSHQQYLKLVVGKDVGGLFCVLLWYGQSGAGVRGDPGESLRKTKCSILKVLETGGIPLMATWKKTQMWWGGKK